MSNSMKLSKFVKCCEFLSYTNLREKAKMIAAENNDFCANTSASPSLCAIARVMASCPYFPPPPLFTSYDSAGCRQRQRQRAQSFFQLCSYHRPVSSFLRPWLETPFVFSSLAQQVFIGCKHPSRNSRIRVIELRDDCIRIGGKHLWV
jgi:hypothetical protein